MPAPRVLSRPVDRRRPRPSVMLAVGMLGQAASAAAVNGAAFLIPALHADGYSLSRAGLVAAASLAGSTCTLVAWGAFVDRVGERVALTASLGLTALALAGAALSSHHGWVLALLLFLAGAACGGTASASGRLVIGWFPPDRRGTAMGFRQTAQPIGVGVAALTIPVLAQRSGVGVALVAPATLAAAATLACLAAVVDPPRPERTAAVAANPYRADSFLARVHAASVLLVVPQFTVWTFMLVWLEVGRGWSPGAAGALVAGTQLLGAGGRVLSGSWSDRVGSRTRPMRQIALLASVTMLALGLAVARGWWSAVPLIVVASVITVADNGLAFTAVAERAGPFWSGRALGVQNTGQYLTASAVPPVVGALIPLVGYGASFALIGLLPILAAPLVPHDRA